MIRITSMTDRTLTLQEAADHLGVHYMTAYRYVRLGKLNAAKTGATWEVRQSDLDEFTTSGAQQPAPKSTKSWDRQLEKVLLTGDEAAAWSVVESALASGRAPSEIYTEILAPTLRRIGEYWQLGKITVADEHKATHVAVRIVGRLAPRFNRRGRPKGTIVVAAPPADFHALAVMMLSDLIRGAGYRTVDLGAAVPDESLAQAVRETSNPTAVAISAFTPDNEVAIRAAIAAIRAVSPGLPIFLGGHAIDGANHAKGLGATAYAESVTDLQAWLEAPEVGPVT